MQLLDFMRFHLIETLIGLALSIGGAYKALTYIPLPDDVPVSAPALPLPIWWVIALSGIAILAWAAFSWSKTRVR